MLAVKETIAWHSQRILQSGEKDPFDVRRPRVAARQPTSIGRGVVAGFRPIKLHLDEADRNMIRLSASGKCQSARGRLVCTSSLFRVARVLGWNGS